MLSASTIRSLYNAFSPVDPLVVHVPRNLEAVNYAEDTLSTVDPRYVDFSEVRDSAKVLQRMARKIRWSDHPTCQLLSGHRGCGKTTELNVLISELQKDDPPYFVVYCEADSLLSLDDVNALDVLLAVARRVAEDVTALGVELTSSKFVALWQSLSSHIEITGADFGSEITKIGMELRQNASLRSLVRQRIATHNLNKYVDAINEIIQSARHQLQARGYADLVMVVDNLDRILRTPIPYTSNNQQEELFIANSVLLTSLDCFLIYTVPPALVHSSRGEGLQIQYGTEPYIIPMIPVETLEGKRYQPGIDKLMEALEKRVAYVGATFEEVFDTRETAEWLCEVSGGYLRGLMGMMRTAIASADDLPMNRKTIEEVVRQSRRLYASGIYQEHWDILDQVHRTKRVPTGRSSVELQDNLAILEYADDQGIWFDVNPVLLQEDRFRIQN